MKVLQHLHGRAAQVLLVPFLTLFLALSAGAQTGGKAKDLHIVAVGISAIPGQQALPSCKKDAEDMVKWANAQKGKLYENVHATAPLVDTQATRANILKAVADMKSRAKPGDTSMLLLSSHGICARGQWFFGAYDGEITWSEFQTALQGIQGTVIVLVDCCQSGGIRGDNMIIFSASLNNQSTCAAGTAAQNSEFTAFVLAGLTGKADFDSDGYVTRSELETYVSNRMRKAHNHRQNVTVTAPGNMASDFQLAKLTAAVAVPALAGTTWTGTEQLAAPYGKLTFMFKENGKVTMIDGHDTIEGTYTQNGNDVAVIMPGACSYQGKIEGTRFTGRGIDRTRNWAFSVNKK